MNNFSINSTQFFNNLGEIIFWYPYLMSIIWIAGSLIFSHSREKNTSLNLSDYSLPPISILVPCYNEENTISETINHLSSLSYPDFEIIAVNDGSSDKTGDLLKLLANKYDCLKVIDCHENRGKANALHIASHASKNEFLICVDSDAILDDNAPYHLIKHFLKNGERVGAVTGNPRIRNRDTILGKLQLVEYSSIIGSIKRTQRILGKIMTVSGVIVAFRKKALVSVNLWDRDMITEDIAISWKLQRDFWDIRYEPNALCWMLVPENLSGLWKQRIRWAQGGQEIIFRHFNIFKDWRQRRLWPIYIEQVCSTIWSFLWLIFTINIVINDNPPAIFWFTFSSFSLAMLSLIQLFISIKTESKYDNIFKYYIWSAWYPVIYWAFNALVSIAALPKSIKSTLKGGYAVWSSPDRGSTISNDLSLSEVAADISVPDSDYNTTQEKFHKHRKTHNYKHSFSSKNLLVNSRQNIIKKVLGILFSSVVWFYMFLVFFLFISAIFDYNNDFIGLLKTNLKMDNEDIRSFILLSLIIFILSFTVLYLWKLYNKMRFGRLNRRKNPNKTTCDDMLSLNLVSKENYNILQTEKIITFSKNPIREL